MQAMVRNKLPYPVNDLLGVLVLMTSLTGKFMVLLLMTMVLLGLLWLLQPTTLPIKRVYVEGDIERLDINDLRSLVGKKANGGFFNLNISAMRAALIELPWVRDVVVYRVWPDGLRLVIHEQTAFARWKDTGLLNEYGEYFAPGNIALFNHLPVLQGPEEAKISILEKFKLLRKAGLPVAYLQLDERRAWQFEMTNGTHIMLGKTDFEARVKRLVGFAVNSKKLAQVQKIDMRYTNGLAVSWK